MSILQILKYPNPNLRQQAATVKKFDQNLKLTIDDMLETMKDAKGIGLAATQVDIHSRIIVIDLSEDYSDPQIFINPEMSIVDETLSAYTEGCLSIPGVQENIERPSVVIITASDANGDIFKAEYTGLMATCIQHEINHLDGKLIIDFLSKLKKDILIKKLSKNKNTSSRVIV